MKKKRKPGPAVLFIVLIAVLGGLGYYIYLGAGPPAITPPAAERENHGSGGGRQHPSDLSSPVDRASTTSAVKASSAAPLEQPPAPLSDSIPGAHESPADTAPGDPRSPGTVTGKIQPPSLSEPGSRASPSTADPDASGFSPAPGPEHQGYPDGSCEGIESDMQELFSHLDRKDYLSPLDLEAGTYDRFKEVVAALSAAPPVPAGEGLDPRVLLNNIYHLYRNLNITDIRLLRNVLRQERDEMELYMQRFYRWLSLADRCPDDIGVRPAGNTLYLYAGFFLNTTGGRAIIFRRDPAFRILFTYYCLVIIHEADREKRNIYGIDILPFIEPLTDEIAYHPDLIFRDQYMSRLKDLADYYRENR